MPTTRRDLIYLLSAFASGTTVAHALPLADVLYSAQEVTSSGDSPLAPLAAAKVMDYHGYVQHDLIVDGCAAHVVLPDEPLEGRPWVWRARFWDLFQGADIAFLKAGFHVAFIDVGNTFGCPDAMIHFDAFYTTVTKQYEVSAKVGLEGLSRGGLYAYRWAYVNTDKIGCIYGDAPVCDMKSWPGGKGRGVGSLEDWKEAIKDYHFANEREMMEFKGNPIDILKPIAAAHIPIIHVCGDTDTTVPEAENTDIVRRRYMALGGDFVLIVKEGCDHHPHGLVDPTLVVNFMLAHCAVGDVARKASLVSPKSGSVIRLTPGQW